MSALLLLLGGASGFVLPTQPGLCRPGTAAAAVSSPTVLHAQAVPTRAAAAPVQMGLFGLGYPELAVIGLVGIVLLGPERLAPMAKDLGKGASGLKEVTDSFAQGMAEGEVGLANEKKVDGMKTADPLPMPGEGKDEAKDEAKADEPKKD